MRKMKTIKLLIAAAAVVGIVGGASAAIYTETFDSVDAGSGWAVRDFPQAGDGSGAGSFSVAGDAFEVTADGSGGSPVDDWLSVQSGSSVLADGGNFTLRGVKAISFDFYVNPNNDVTAGSPDFSNAALYFVGGAGNHVWTWAFSPFGYESSGTRNIKANIETIDPGYGGEWFSTTGTFANDLTSITEIGVLVTYLNAPTQIISLDNFTLHAFAFYVPEPETYAAIAAAMLGMAFVFRKRLREIFAALPAFGQAAA